MTTITYILALVGKDHQTNLPRGNFNELQMADLGYTVKMLKEAVQLSREPDV